MAEIAALADYYAVLGVERSATPQDIKRAYFRLIRKFTPEDSPERFREVSEAYGCLSNPEKRKVYDTQERLPPDVQTALSEAHALLDDTPHEAVRALQVLVRRHPEIDTVRFALGHAHIAAEEYAAAVEEFQRLHRRRPTEPSYICAWGIALLRGGQEAEAAKRLREAIVLNPTETYPYLILADAYMGIDKDQEALTTLERGINADGKVDIADVSLFLRKMMVLAKLRDFSQMESTGRAVVRLVPPGDAEARGYVVDQLIQLAKFFDNLTLPQFTKVVVDAAVAVDPENSELKAVAERLAAPGRTFREYDLAMRDESLGNQVKLVLYCTFVDDVTDEQRREGATSLGNAMATDPAGCDAQFVNLRRKYPEAAKAISDDWHRIRGSVIQQNTGSGCVVLLAALAASATAVAASLALALVR